jgi:hypothetical protein
MNIFQSKMKLLIKNQIIKNEIISLQINGNNAYLSRELLPTIEREYRVFCWRVAWLG